MPVPTQTTAADPVTAILIVVTEMRGMLAAAVTDLTRHDVALADLRARSEHERVLVATLEVQIETLPKHAVSPAAVWSVLGVAAAAISAFAVVLSLFLTAH